MKFISLPLLSLWLLTTVSCGQTSTSKPTLTQRTDSVYQYRDATRDGIGKVYKGREIAQVMGHLGAEWLERPEREQEERTDLLLKLLRLKPTDVVADIGAGTGYFSFRLAPELRQGKVLAVDIQQEMIDLLNQAKQKNKAANVEAVLGTISDPKLPPNSIDMALMVDAYHEFSHPYEIMRNIANALKPNGRVVLVEYRAEDPNVPIKELHKMSVTQAKKELQAVGLQSDTVYKDLPQQHVIIFSKRAAKN